MEIICRITDQQALTLIQDVSVLLFYTSGIPKVSFRGKITRNPCFYCGKREIQHLNI